MGTRKVEVKVSVESGGVGRGVRAAEKELARLNKSTGVAGRAMSALGTAVKVGAVAGFAALGAAVAVGVGEMKEQAAVSAQTGNVLRNLGKTTSITKGQVEGIASAMQAATGAADDQIQSASNVILRFGLIRGSGKQAESQLRDLTTTALDLSVATGKDLTASSLALSRALGDPTKAAGVLRRAGILLTKSQQDSIKEMVKHGDAARAQATVLDLVKSRVKGSADAFGKTIPGQVEKAKRAFEDFSEGMVVAVAPALTKLLPPLLSIMKSLAPVFEQFASVAADALSTLVNDQGMREFGSTLRDIVVGGLRAVMGALQAVLPIVSALAGAFSALVNFVKGNAVAMTAFGAVLGSIALAATVAKVRSLVEAFRDLAIVQTISSGISGLGSTISGLGSSASTLVRGLSGASAASVGLAPGLTAAGAAAGMAKTATAGLGASLMAAAGGPIGLAVIGVGAVAGAVAVLASGMFSGESAAEAYARTLDGTKRSADGARSAIDGLGQAVNQAARAQLDAKDAQARLVDATARLKQAQDQYGTRSPQYAQAFRDQRRAVLDYSDAQQRAKQAQNDQITKAQELKTKIQGLAPAIAAHNNSLRANQMALWLTSGSSKEAAAKYAALRTEYAQHLKSPAELKKVQDEARAVADSLKGQTSPAAVNARKALNELANAKVGKGGDLSGVKAASEKAGKALDELTTKTGSAKGKTNSNLSALGNVAGAVGTHMSALLSSVQSYGEQIVASSKSTHDQANANFSNIAHRSVPVAPTVRGHMAALHRVVDDGGRKIRKSAQETHDLANMDLAAVGRDLDRYLGNAAVRKAQVARDRTAPGSEARSKADARLEAAKSRRDSTTGAFRQAFVDAGAKISDALRNDTFERFGPNPNDIRIVKSKFSLLSSELEGSLKTIDDTLTAALKTVDDNLDTQNNAIEKALKGVLVDNLDAIMPEYAAKVREIKTQFDTLSELENSLTPAEQALKDFDAAAAATDLQSNVAEAQRKLQEARDYGTTADVEAAEKSLAEAQRAVLRSEMQKTAEQERLDRDATIATKRAKIEEDAAWVRGKITTDAENLRTQKNNEAAADRAATQAIYEARRIEMETELATMEAQFARVPEILKGKKGDARKQLQGLKDMFARWGLRAGTVYNSELDGALSKMGGTLAKRIAKEVQPYLELHSPAKKGPLSRLDEWFRPFADTLLSPVDTGALATASYELAASSMPTSIPVGSGVRGGTTVVNVTVNGNEFSAREFARKLQPELDRIVSYSGV